MLANLAATVCSSNVTANESGYIVNSQPCCHAADSDRMSEAGRISLKFTVSSLQNMFLVLVLVLAAFGWTDRITAQAQEVIGGARNEGHLGFPRATTLW